MDERIALYRADNCSRYLISLLTGIPEEYIGPELYQPVTSLVAGFLVSNGLEVNVPVCVAEKEEE